MPTILPMILSTVGKSRTPPEPPTLADVTVSPATGTVGTPYSATIFGGSGGSFTISGAGSDGLTVSGTTISGTPTTAGAINVTETLVGAVNSPHTTTGVVAIAAAVAPANVTPPSLTGVAKVGSDLTGGNGTWSGSEPISYTYQWQVSSDGSTGWANISGATSATYEVVAGDLSKYLRRQTTATNIAGSDSIASDVKGPVISGSAGLTNDVAPSFIQPDGSGGWEAAVADTINTAIFLDAGQWSGGTKPYHFEYAIYDADDDSVIAARGSGTELEAGELFGKTVYGRVWCIDDAATEVYADTTNFGPFITSFEPETQIKAVFRATAGASTFGISDNTDWLAVVNASETSGAPKAAYPDGPNVTEDSTEYAAWGAAGTLSDRTGTGPLKGHLALATNAANFSVALDNGWYRGRLVAGPVGTNAGKTALQFMDGDNSTGDTLWKEDSGATVSKGATEQYMFENDETGAIVPVVVARSAAEEEVVEDMASGTTFLFQIKKGIFTVRRSVDVSTGGGYISCIEIESAPAPEVE